MDVTDHVRAYVARLPEGVQAHIEQVRLQAVSLAKVHRLDVERAEIAAIAHDVCRVIKAENLLEMAQRFKIHVSLIDRAFPVFLHGPVGAGFVKQEFGLHDEEVLDAVRYHTVGRSGMKALEQAIFLADKLDPSKIRRYPFLPQVMEAAHRDLNEGMRDFIDNQAAVFLRNGDLIHPGMVAARNDALMALRD